MFSEKVLQAQQDLIATRRYLHAHAELSYEEYETTAYLVNELKKLQGVEILCPAKTGVVAVLKGDSPGRTIAFRADIDALPIEEQTDLPFRSRNEGVMHACGHDGHAAMQLEAVKLLAEERKSLKGEVRFIFQHAEEKPPGGAAEMLHAGIMEGVEELYGLHLSSSYPTGHFGVRSGALTSATDRFEMRVTGSEGHSAFPESCVDPVVTAAQIVTDLQTIVSRRIPASEAAVVSVCVVKAGSVCNVIPRDAYLSGATRTFEKKTREALPGMMEQIVKGICDAHGASYQFRFEKGYASVVNDLSLTELSRSLLTETFGPDRVFDIGLLMPGEDFSALQENCPGFFAELGAGSAEGCDIPHHNSHYCMDEDALLFGLEYIYRQVKNRLS